MKIGTMVRLNDMQTLEGKLKSLREMGFDNCQLCSWEPQLWTAENAAIVRDLLKTYGITPSSFWCGWEGPREWNFYEGQLTLGLVPAQYRQLRIRNLCDGADFALAIGINEVATHMGFIPENPFDPNFEPLCDAIRTVAQHLKDQGQWLLFETGQETPVTMLRCFETVGTGNLGVNLDTANLILYGKANPVDALDVFGTWVRNIHAKDGCYPTNGRELGEETALGQGKVDFKGLFAKLKELGYNSWVTIEREISGPRQIEDIRFAKEYLTTIIDEIYGEGTVC